MDKKSGLEEFKRRVEKTPQMGGKQKLDRLLDPGTFMETGLLEEYEIPDSGGKQLAWLLSV